MVELEPELSAILKVYRDVIEHRASDSVYRPCRLRPSRKRA